MRAQVLIFLGAPGAGKGTQATEASKEFGIPQISTGEILREAVARRMPLGLAAKAKMEQGELVPDEVVCGIVEDRVSRTDCRNGFILDGFPRTVAQAVFLDDMLERRGLGKPLVVNLQVESDVLLKRLTGRRTCPVCGKIYNIYFSPPRQDELCDVDGTPLQSRADDNEGSIRRRLEAYERQTRPLIDYYRERTLLHETDGNREPPVIARDLAGELRYS